MAESAGYSIDDDCSIEHTDTTLRLFGWRGRWMLWQKRRCHERRHRASCWVIDRADGRSWFLCSRCGHAYTSEAIAQIGSKRSSVEANDDN